MRKFFEGPPNASGRKQATIEGAMGDNQWTWAVEAGLFSLGLESAIHFHNCPDPISRLSDWLYNRLNKSRRPGVFIPWTKMSNRKLINLANLHKTPLVISLQGRLDREAVENIRDINPIIRIIYWRGAPVRNEEQIQQLLEMDSLVDALPLTCQKDVQTLRTRGAENITHLPFAACPFHHHRKVKINTRLKRKYSAEVSLICDRGDYEEELACKTSEALGIKVNVWGDKGWEDNRWINYKGPIRSPSELKIYACSSIVINTRGQDFLQHNGLNPAFFKIPAAGGFQITEELPFLDELHPLNSLVSTFRSPDELARKARFHLHHSNEREKLRKLAQSHILENETYGHRFHGLFEEMSFGQD